MHPTEGQKDAPEDDLRQETDGRPGPEGAPIIAAPFSPQAFVAPDGARPPHEGRRDGLFDTHPETPQSLSSHPSQPRDAELVDRTMSTWTEQAAAGELSAAQGQSMAAGWGSGPGSSRGSHFPPVDDHDRPSYVFLGVVAGLSLFADISTKVWAELVLNQRGFEPIALIGDNVNITLAYNDGGAWGLFASADKMVRLPFFLSVSIFAIFFIVSLYARLHPSQRALKWGLPLVLGGALGNLSDRITRSRVIDFIDYRADWVLKLNAFVNRYFPNWTVTDHWPTFNVADIAICVGVVLMGIDMFTHRHRSHSAVPPVPPAASQSGESSTPAPVA